MEFGLHYWPRDEDPYDWMFPRTYLRWRVGERRFFRWGGFYLILGECILTVPGRD